MQQTTPSLFLGLRALIADPDTRFARSLKEYLENLGFAVRTSSSAQEAEELAGEESFDLLITEILLEYPDSGFVLAHRVRQRTPSTRIVIVSGVSFRTGLHFDLSDAEFRSWIEADEILDKDIRFEQLGQILNLLFRNRRK